MTFTVCLLKDRVSGTLGKPIIYCNQQEAIYSFLASLDDPDFPEDLSDRLQLYETGFLLSENNDLAAIQYVPHIDPVLLCSGKEVVDLEKD